MESHWVHKPLFKAGPMPSSRCSAENKEKHEKHIGTQRHAFKIPLKHNTGNHNLSAKDL